eukprot:5967687-Prymnesium_polylepis.1
MEAVQAGQAATVATAEAKEEARAVTAEAAGQRWVEPQGAGHTFVLGVVRSRLPRAPVSPRPHASAQTPPPNARRRGPCGCVQTVSPQSCSPPTPVARWSPAAPQRCPTCAAGRPPPPTP